MSLPPTPSSGLVRRGGTRTDIQFVRALAVGLVLAYHLWPLRLPGGFIGVDVFFVVSGFLITAHLLQEAESTGRIRLARFWGRRALRLLPLATLVLLATVAAVALWAPPSSWGPALEGVIASALYWQNWALAAGAVDYLARDRAPLPTQHFWSLSVEEQFYLVWPLLLLLGLLAARLLPRASGALSRRRALLGVIILAGGISFAHSLWLTAVEPQTAYFATTARAWQFAAGALLAFLPAADPAARGAARAGIAAGSWSGLVLIAIGSFVIDGSTPYPGVAALVPVVGTVLLLWCGTARIAWTPARFGDARPLEVLGDLSYGIYLWHWPLIVLAPGALGRDLTAPDKLVIAAAAVGLAWVSKRAVEDPFRYGRIWNATPARRFAPGATGMLGTVTAAVLVASLLSVSVFRGPQDAVPPPESAVAVDGELRPTIPQRAADYGLMYDCFDMGRTTAYRCDYGPPDAPVSIAISGDSHGAHWIPALVAAAEGQEWRVSTFVGLNCDSLLQPLCPEGGKVLDEIAAGDFDLIIIGGYRFSSTPIESVEDSLTALAGVTDRTAVLATVPVHAREAFECLDASFPDSELARTCTTPRTVALEERPDRMGDAARRLSIPLIDLTDVFCDGSRCRSIIGDIVVYQDSPTSHMTRTFSASLGDLLRARIQAELDRPPAQRAAN